MRGFSSTRACMAVLSLLVVAVLFMGLTGSPIYRSWPFVMLLLYFMAQVGARLIFEIEHFNQAHLSALVSHFGIYFLLAAGIFGYGDKKRLTISLPLEEETSIGIDTEGKVEHLPFSLKLQSFHLEEYPCELVFPEGCSLTVVDSLENAVPDSIGGYKELSHMGAMQAFYVHATYRGEKYEGWVTPGSFLFPSSELQISDSLSIYARPAMAKSYLSRIALRDEDEEHDVSLRVNHPYHIGAWHIYQKSYDQEMGRWSRVSVVECVRDAWYPLAFIAMWMFLLSGVFMIFERKRR